LSFVVAEGPGGGAYETNMGNPSIERTAPDLEEAWRVRLDRWRRVRHLLDSAELGAGRWRSECVQAAGSLLHLLAPEERQWDFPSATALAELREQVAKADVSAAAAAARAIMAKLETT
jgi:hypothetical protein